MGKQSRRKQERRDAPPRSRDELFQEVVRQGPPKPKTPMDEAFDEEGYVATWEPLYNYSQRHPLWLSTAALQNLSKLGEEAGMTRRLDPALDLEPNGRHYVMWAARHWTHDFKYDNVRCMLALQTRDHRAGAREPSVTQQIVDLPTKQFAMLAALGVGPDYAQRAKLDDIHLQLANDLGLDTAAELAVRQWTGTRSMEHSAGNLTAFWHLMAAHEVYGTPEGVRERFLEFGWPLGEVNGAITSAEGPRLIQAPSMLRQMNIAHPIVCEPEWVQAMDDFDSWDEAIEFAKTFNLPFDAIYLDLASNGNLYHPLVPIDTLPREKVQMKTVTDGTGAAKLSGALLFRDEENRLVVTPFGTDGRVPERRGGYTTIDPLGFSVNDVLGIVTFGIEPQDPIGEMDVNIQGSAITRKVLAAAPIGGGPRGVSPVKVPAMIELPFNLAQLEQSGHGATADPASFAHIWASLAWAATRRVLRTMHMLQAGNVELVDALVSRQVRRAGERAGLPISKQVIVRLNRKAYSRPPGLEEGVPVEWSHAWWVSGHPRYYPLGTRKADAQPPDKLVNHPSKGVCFMEWVPPYIKGNRARGVVEKTRVVRDRKEAA